MSTIISIFFPSDLQVMTISLSYNPALQTHLCVFPAWGEGCSLSPSFYLSLCSFVNVSQYRSHFSLHLPVLTLFCIAVSIASAVSLPLSVRLAHFRSTFRNFSHPGDGGAHAHARLCAGGDHVTWSLESGFVFLTKIEKIDFCI